MVLLMCFVIVRAYGVNKVDKGPREVLNPEIQKVRLKLVQGKLEDVQRWSGVDARVANCAQLESARLLQYSLDVFRLTDTQICTKHKLSLITHLSIVTNCRPVHLL